jgi:citrate synthase
MVGSSHGIICFYLSRSFSTLGTFARWSEPSTLEMLEEIHRTGGDADKYLAKAKDKK